MKKFRSILLLLAFPWVVWGQFSDVKNLTEARGRISVATFDDTVLFVGGSDSDIVDYLDVSDCSITAAEYGRDGFTGAQVIQDERFAVFYDLGGVNLSALNMYIYDHNTQTWQTEQYPNGASQDIEGGFIDDGVVVFVDNDDTNSFYTYNLLAQEWGTRPAGFTRRETTIIDTGEKVFFLGGRPSRSTRSDSVHVYNKSTALWDAFVISEAKNELTAVQYQDKIVIAGGQSSNANSDRSVDLVEIIDIDDYTIETTNLSEKKNNLVGVVVGDKVIFAGGNSQNAEVINMVDLTVTTFDFNVSQNQTYLNGAAVGNWAVFAGGNNVDGNQVFLYDNDTETWSSFIINQARSNIAFASIDNRLFAAGGEIVFGDEEFDEVYILDYIPTSTVDLEAAGTQVKLFPNPTSTFLSFRIREQPIEQVSIMDMNGKIIRTINRPYNSSIDVSNLAQGTYMLSLLVKGRIINTRFSKID